MNSICFDRLRLANERRACMWEGCKVFQAERQSESPMKGEKAIDGELICTLA